MKTTFMKQAKKIQPNQWKSFTQVEMKNDTRTLTVLLNKEIRLKKKKKTLSLLGLDPFKGSKLLISAKSQFK